MAGATEIYQFVVSCDPVVVATAPQITNITMPTRTVNKIRVRIPPGPNGVMGFAIGSTGVTVIPTVKGTFIVASDEVIDWEPDNFIDSGSWQVLMYNTGIFTHSIYITFTTELPDLPEPVVPGGFVVTSASDATPAVDTVTPDSTIPPPPELTQ